VSRCIGRWPLPTQWRQALLWCLWINRFL